VGFRLLICTIKWLYYKQFDVLDRLKPRILSEAQWFVRDMGSDISLSEPHAALKECSGDQKKEKAGKGF
jgi:hypothetical protein